MSTGEVSERKLLSARFFSALKFYTLATGSPLERSRTLVTFDCEIPQRGTLLIPPDLRGESELVWIHGVAALGEQRQEFIDTIRAGEIPTPLSASTARGSCPHVRYHPLESLHAREHTVASLLALTKPLVVAASRSRWAKCPSCAQSLPLFHNPTELCDHLLTTLRDKECRIELVGLAEEISSWATEKGFTLGAQPGGQVSVRVDSLTCSPQALQKVEPILASTKKLPNTWLTITHEDATEEYGWNGRCARCNITLTPFNASAARDLIDRPASNRSTHEGCRMIDDTSLSELLSAPIARILNGHTVQELLSPLQREAIQTLSLETLTLATITTNLAPQSLAAVALLDLARDTGNAGELCLFPAPASSFSSDLLPSVQSLIEKLSLSRPFVWITDNPSPPATGSIAPSAATPSRRLGSLSLNNQPAQRIEIECGRLNELQVPLPLRHLRIAPLMHEALAGKRHELVTSEIESPVTPFLVPLFPSEPSTTRLVAHALGVIEPLTKMFAASHQAKMLGLTARDFLLGQIRQVASVCAACKGTGIVVTKAPINSAIDPCHTCWGARFRSPAREVTFKGRTLWEILNAPISTSQDTLRALPKMREVLELVTMLGLSELPLGMPVTLLSVPQRRLLAIAHGILSGTVSRPAILVIEEPYAGFSDEQRRGLMSALAHSAFSERVSWLAVL
jgi:hypothetical protein